MSAVAKRSYVQYEHIAVFKEEKRGNFGAAITTAWLCFFFRTVRTMTKSRNAHRKGLLQAHGRF